jgi:cysteine dioxygenase
MGSGEVMHVLSYKALDDKIEEFETVVQEMARLLYSLESEITDVRVCHPKCGEVCFVLTFITREAMTKFQGTIQICSEARLKDLITTGSDPQFSVTGCLMPAAHTLPSLLSYLKVNVVGDNHTEHDVKAVQREIEKWFPRRGEYSQYISYDSKDATKYTRNLIFGNAHMDVILMCWPAGSRSTIHDHDDSSCWVVVVEGSVHEVQYAQPRLDKKFLEAEKVNPATATGSCGNLKVTNTAFLRCGGVTSTYANNEIGLHRVENRTEKLACTLHVYAPPLKKMRIYNEDGKVKVFVATASTRESGDSLTNDPIFDVDAWNAMNISLGESGS